MDAKTVYLNNLNDLADKRLIVSWPGHQVNVSLTKPTLNLGRIAKGNDVVIDYPVVSRYHAMLKWENGGYHIYDGQIQDGKHLPSTNGLFFQGKQIKERGLKNGDIIRIPDRSENFITLQYLDSSVAPSKQIIQLNQTVTIGRDKQNVLHLDALTTSRFHAKITPIPGRGHLLNNLNSDNRTYVNGQSITQVELKINDIIQIGSVQLRYDGTQLIPADLHREGIRLEAIDIRKQVKVKKEKPTDTGVKILLSGISLVIQPCEFVALVGVSGAGKSTFLDALNGSRPTDGKVLINGDDLYQNFDAYRQNIGYVPQKDIIHHELTVEEALRYVAQLRLPVDTPPKEIDEQIDKVLDKVAMSDKKQVIIKQLSGGQQKRVNIAVELIADPGIIFLDEPTSGLDPGLDGKMMFTLKELAKSGKTIILVTHATENVTNCDMVAFLAAGGRLVFYGPPAESLKFFNVTSFAQIYNKVEQESEKWIKAFQTSSYYETYIKGRFQQTCPRCSQPLNREQAKFCPRCGHNFTANQEKKAAPKKETNSLFKRIAVGMRQFKILTQRYMTLLLRDRRNFLFLLLQSPVIALFLFLVIDPTLLSKDFNDFSTTVKQSEVLDIQKILFILSCIATWFGIINSIREIVKELPIYYRERLVNLNVIAYIFSKLAVLFGLGFVQAFLLVFVVNLRMGFSSEAVFLPHGLLEIFITVLLVTFTSTCFGLLLSAVVGREDRVMSIMPIFLIPQIVFAGVVFKLEGLGKLVSYFTFSRWGIEALGSTINLVQINDLTTSGTGKLELPFDFTHGIGYLLQAWGILGIFAILLIFLTILALNRQDAR